MIQQNKKGFSLVEVMILFTVLAVILAAALPTVTRKSSPIPNKINHGVYRCINDGGTLIQELYTGTTLVQRQNGVERCTFRVPEAALYKVNLYSAGAGGTLGAQVTARLDDTRNAVFRVSGDYSNTEFADIENPSFDIRPETALPMQLSNSDIEHFFHGEQVIRSQDTGNAGAGGNASFSSYPSPVQSSCVGKAARASQAEQDFLGKRALYDSTSTDYDSELKTLDKTISDNDKLSGEYGKLADKLDEKINLKADYEDDQKSLLNLMNLIKNFRSNEESYTKLNDATTVHVDQGVGLTINLPALWQPVVEQVIEDRAPIKAKELYDAANAKRNSLYNSHVNEINECVAKAKKTHIEETVKTSLAEYLKKNVSEELKEADATALFNEKEKSNVETNAGKYFDTNLAQGANSQCQTDKGINLSNYDEDNTKADEPYRIYDHVNDTGVRPSVDAGNSCDYMYPLKSYKNANENVTKTRLSNYLKGHAVCVNEDDRAKQLYGNGTGSSISVSGFGAVSIGIVSRYKNVDRGGIEPLYNRAYYLYNEAGNKLKALEEEEASKSFEDQKDEAINKKADVDKAKSNAEKAKSDKIGTLEADATKAKELWEDLLAGDFNSILDNNYGFTDASVIEENTALQMQQFCKELYGQYSEEVLTGTKSDSAVGAPGGRGRRLRLTYTIGFNPEATLEQQLNYLRTINQNIRPMHCRSVSENGVGSSCFANMNFERDLTGTPVQNKNYEQEKTNHDPVAFTIRNGIKRIFNTSDGLGLSAEQFPYAAWQVPTLNNGIVRATQNLSLVSMLPTGGGKAKMQVDETKKGTYTEVQIPSTVERTPKNIADYIFKNNYAYKIEKDSAEEAVNATFLPKLENQPFDETLGTTFSLDTELGSSGEATVANPLSQEPQVTMEANLWTKTYRLGSEGGAGQESSFIVSNLGNRCTFDVPDPGEVYEFGGNQSIRTLEEALTLRMTCFNRDGEAILERQLHGGTYNPTVPRAPGKFHWFRNMPPQVFEAEHLAENDRTWFPSSIWARAYELMGGFDAYDLNAYGVGYAGHGTSITDSCTVAKGNLSLKSQRLVGTAAGVTTQDTAMPPKNYVFDGKMGDTECYGHQENDEQQVVSFWVSEDGDQRFSISAGEGGGGAVVITW